MRSHIVCLVFLSVSSYWLTDIFAKDPSFSQQAKEYRKIGYLAYLQGDLEKAYQFFKKSAYLNPGYAIVHNDLGIIYEKRGLKELAAREYLEAISLDPRYPPAYMNLALLYEELGNRQKALYYLKERIKLGKRNNPWRKRAEELVQRFGLASNVETRPDKFESAKTGSGETEVARDLLEEARKEKLTSSAEQDLGSEQLLMSGKMYYEKKDFTRALEEFKKLEELEPGNPEVGEYIKNCEGKINIEKLYAEGRVALDNADFTLAISKIRELLMLDPMYKDAQDILVSAEKERFVHETRQEESPVIKVNIP